MFRSVGQKIFGSRNQRLVKRMRKVVEQINALEPQVEKLTDDELRAKTDEFRKRYAEGSSLDDLLVEVFAVVREGGRRSLGMRHFDVQLVGGMVLHQGKIAEMRTGEGKTLVGTLAVYLNAIAGNGVHVVTVNEYLAKRDAEWMGKLYEFLGLTVGVIHGGQDREVKRAAYAADITYGTNNEFGFDYLRDNMAFSAEDRVQRGSAFAVVDEVDSILIDEARTPLIISGPAEDDTALYQTISKLVPALQKSAKTPEEGEEPDGDFTVDEKSKQVHLTEQGNDTIEVLFRNAGILGEDESVYDSGNIALVHHLNAALRAQNLFQRDVDYIVSGREIVIVDEFTGRTMPGRRWSDGLHQAVEAKEGVPIQRENHTLASITFQNYFRLYEKLAGMTGTADTEAFELQSIYGLEVVVIPTNKPMMRIDAGDRVFLSTREKYDAIVEDIREGLERNQPILVGTASVEASELLSGLLDKQGIKHNVLNAKQHAREAQTIAEAGRPGTVTIATNMAGRGTDIVLGGNPEVEIAALEDAESDVVDQINSDWKKLHAQVIESGGLRVIGTERHESRRIDNQLRGRSGRQGDPGSTQFYLSLEDSLMRIFASPRLQGFMQKLGMEEGEAIEHPWVTKAIGNAQRKVEAHNFDIRKNLLEYDDVANEQRKVVYQQRNEFLDNEDISEEIDALREMVVDGIAAQFVPRGSLPEQWNLDGLKELLRTEFGTEVDVADWPDQFDTAQVRDEILKALIAGYKAKEELGGPELLRSFEKQMVLQVLDNHWKEHLAAMDYLRQGINLRSYAQKNPKQEYKREAYAMFNQLMDRVRYDLVSVLSRVQIRSPEEVEAIEQQRLAEAQKGEAHHDSVLADSDRTDDDTSQGGASSAGSSKAGKPVQKRSGSRPAPRAGGTLVRNAPKVGRNDPCPCGSGKKYKQCHGKLS